MYKKYSKKLLSAQLLSFNLFIVLYGQKQCYMLCGKIAKKLKTKLYFRKCIPQRHTADAGIMSTINAKHCSTVFYQNLYPEVFFPEMSNLNFNLRKQADPYCILKVKKWQMSVPDTLCLTTRKSKQRQAQYKQQYLHMPYFCRNLK